MIINRGPRHNGTVLVLELFMDYNYHTHTFRCSHATGTEEEYILRAIEGGIRYMGFSEHAPLKLPDGTEHYYRLQTADIEDYFSSLRALREKYREQIEISIGFEMEYYPEYFDEMLRLARDSGAEYLILGQHQLCITPDYIHSYRATDDPQLLARFVDITVEAMQTGVFSYVAHPDLIRFEGDGELYCRQMRRICLESLRLNIPIELNFLGIREGRAYPNMRFWQIAGEVGAPVTFGFDAHGAQAAYDGDSYEKAMSTVGRFHLNYIGKPSLISI